MFGLQFNILVVEFILYVGDTFSYCHYNTYYRIAIVRFNYIY